MLPPPYTVILDANIWIAERLLQSSLGNALLYAVAGSKATIGLPEVVQREIGRILPEMAEQAARNIKRDVTVLRQLSGHQMMVTAPSPLAVTDGIAKRWSQLAGSIESIPFTIDQAESALARIIDGKPPCGENNEQFRDCCIWDAAVTLGSNRPVHLVTSDNAFYEGRKPSNGLVNALKIELEHKKVKLSIHPTLRDLLATLKDTSVAIDKIAIGKAIIESLRTPARAIAAEKGKFELGEPLEPKIKGYATPKAALVAVSYEVTFELERVIQESDAERREQAYLTVEGECDYDPNRNSISEIEIKGWSQRIDFQKGGTSWGQHRPSREALEQYDPRRLRFIS